MKLLQDLITEDVEFLTEEVGGKKHNFIKGIFLMAEAPNRNGRLYPMSVLEPQVALYNETYVHKNRALGELNHPETPVVNPERAAIMVTELSRSGTDFIGKAKVLSTPMGAIVRGLLSDGVQLGVSSRGTGNVKKKGSINIVEDGFKLFAIDVVQDPSAHKAFVEAIMENVDWVFDAATGSWKAERIIEEITETVDAGGTKVINEEAAAKWFEAFVRTLSARK